jgi:glycosyltransferase involved in cell wall biosynthesis
VCSVVVPAHDEAAVITDRLGRLLASVPPGTVEVVVVANGCSDDTAAAARRLPGVRVVELSEPSKTAALNAGDLEATCFPRIYLDADIRISGATLLRLADALSTERAVVAAPRVSFDVSGSSWPVRAFYAAFQRLPYAADGLIGLGVYGFSESARRRFGEFPAVVADDLYVQRLFPDDERCTVDATFGVVAPRTLGSLLAVRTRVARGNRELATRAGELGLEARSTTTDTVRELARAVVREPGLLPAALVYLGVTVGARIRARRASAAAPRSS